MTAVTFNTHKFMRQLETAGFDTRQAEALTDVLAEMLDESTTLTLATKLNINALRQEMRQSKVELIKWITGALIAQAAVVVTLVKLL